MQQSAGHIRVESAVGVGTTFRIYFPRVEEAVTPAPPAAPAPPRAGHETVLVVDDEVEVSALLQTALTTWGYTVLVAASPSEALRLAERHSGPIHLLLTDMVMPEMSGVVLARRLLAVRPGIATVYMSGYADYPTEASSEAEEMRLLQKPFTPEAVARMIREVLDARQPVASR